MCFSTEASFSAAIILGAMGYATLKSANSKSQLFLAVIPFLFAIQQFSEGVLWYNLENNLAPNTASILAEKTFLSFAFLIWPVWIPLSLVAVEVVPWRRNVLYALLAFGITLSLLNLSYAMKASLSAHIVNHSIQYIGIAPSQTLIYPLIVLLPCFFSSYKYIWIFGLLASVSYLIADYYYQTTFISVWCFFAAIISLLLYKVIKFNRETPQTQRE